MTDALNLRAKLGPRPEPLLRWRPLLMRRLGIACLVLICAGLNGLAPLDRWLREERFEALNRAPSGQIVVVALDAHSVPFGDPWPRARIATLLDCLREIGVRQTIFDMDFSAPTNDQDDSLFAEALKRSAGSVALAGYARYTELGGATIARPLPRFRDFALVAQADLPVDADGWVRDYRTGLMLGGRTPSIATLLARQSFSRPQTFGIDYGVDMDAIDRISAGDVIAGSVDRQRLAGKDVVVAAPAEGPDGARMTPRYGALPDTLVHVAAAETLLTDRALRDAPALVTIVLTLLLAVAPGLLPRKTPLWLLAAAATAIAVTLELGALGLQSVFAVRLDTGAPLALDGILTLAGLLAHWRRRRRLHAQASRESELLRSILARVVADHFDGVVVIGPEGLIVAASGAARDLLGADLEGRSAFDVLPREFTGPLARAIARGASTAESPEPPEETQLRSGDGSTREIEFVITLSSVEGSGARPVACLTFRDVTERRTRQERLLYLSRHDELTGAWSGGQLYEGLRERFESGHAEGRKLALFSLNLRRFSTVNNLFGRQTGDKLLRMVVDRLQVSGLTMVTRLGGDNFAFAQSVTDDDDLTAIGAAIIARICEPYRIGEAGIVVGVSLGATTTRISGCNPDDLISHANLAQTAARRRGGDAFAIFSPAMESTQREKQRIDAALRGAIGDGTLELHYQPKIELRTGRMVGAEALMRWRTADGAAVSPTQFIPVAEESGLIVELGRWALREACLECARWEGEASVAVNVSPVQFALADVFADVQLALEASGLPAHRLEIEITEGCFVHRDSGVAQTLEGVRAMGVTIAIDDFGTGYSSLQYLGRLPFDTIKIDQSFIRDLDSDARAAETVRAISTLARTHGKQLVAEGVETEAQANWLASIGCEYVQGYLYARSRDAATLRRDLARQAA